MERVLPGPFVVPFARRKLTELDAHLVERMLKQRQSLNGFRNILAGLLEALDRFDLLLDAELHHADMCARRILIGCHAFAADVLSAIRRSWDGKDEFPLNRPGPLTSRPARAGNSA